MVARRWLLLMALVGTVGAVLVGCGGKQADELRIGAVLPLTGDIAEYGKRCKAGMEMAVEDVNSSGGVKGNTVSIVYEDSRGVPADGVSALRKLIDVDGVRIVIGAVASSVTLAMEPVATEQKVILFSPASSSPKLTGISDYFFRNWPSDVLEATALAEFAYSDLGLRRVSTAYVNNDYGLGLKDEFARRFAELGGEVLAEESYEQGATDFRAQLAKIKGDNPDAVYLAGYHREMALATRQIRELGMDVQILADADYGVPELLEIAGPAAEGAVYSTPDYDPAKGGREMGEFATAFEEAHGEPPTIFEANGYDAVMIICKAAAEVGTDTDRIAEHIASLEHYPGVSGDTSFGRRGEVTKPAAIRTVRDGEFVPYEAR